MAGFPKNKIEVLFALALAKAKVERNRSGFGKLSDLINETKTPGTPFIELKYLDESIDKQLVAVEQGKQEKVGLNREYLDVLVDYVGYENYDVFEKKWEQISKEIELEAYKPLVLLCQKELEADVRNHMKALRYPGQAANLQITLHAFSEPPGLEKALEVKKNEEVYPVLIVAEETWQSQEGKFRKALSNLHFLTILFSETEEAPKPSVGNSLQHLHLFAQMLMELSKQQPVEQADKKNLKHPSTVNITDPGTVFLGKTKIKAEYMSNRDMVINIRKKGK